jgi:hypothetical protein
MLYRVGPCRSPRQTDGETLWPSRRQGVRHRWARRHGHKALLYVCVPPSGTLVLLAVVPVIVFPVLFCSSWERATFEGVRLCGDGCDGAEAELCTTVGAVMVAAVHGPVVASWYLALGPVEISRHARFLWPHYSTNVLICQVRLKACGYLLRCRRDKADTRSVACGQTGKRTGWAGPTIRWSDEALVGRQNRYSGRHGDMPR